MLNEDPQRIEAGQHNREPGRQDNRVGVFCVPKEWRKPHKVEQTRMETRQDVWTRRCGRRREREKVKPESKWQMLFPQRGLAETGTIQREMEVIGRAPMPVSLSCALKA
jgi:hypothetical protein